jgi:serine protease
LHSSARWSAAIAADVIVVAAAGNCVELLVWPTPFEDRVAIAGRTAMTNLIVLVLGRGPAMTIYALGQINV